MINFKTPRHRLAWAAALLPASCLYSAISLADAPPVGLLAIGQNQVIQKNSPQDTQPWRALGEAYGVTAMVEFRGDVYVTSNNRLWKRGTLGPGSGNSWTQAGEAYNVVAMNVHNDRLYAIADGKLWRRGSIGPTTGNDWAFSGDVPGATAIASHNGHLFITANDKLWQLSEPVPSAVNTWADVGEAYSVSALIAYQDALYALSNGQLWKRGVIGENSGNDWTHAADATGVTTITSGIPVTGSFVTVCGSGCDYTAVPEAVDAIPAGGTVVVGAGTYSAPVALAKNISLIGVGPERTVLTADTGSDPVIKIEKNAQASIRSLSVRNHHSYGEGAGIRNMGNLALQDCVLADNTSETYGGGIANIGSLSIDRCTIQNNAAVIGSGITNVGSLTLERSYLRGNAPLAPDTDGDGLAAIGGITKIRDSTIAHNADSSTLGVEISIGKDRIYTYDPRYNYRTFNTGPLWNAPEPASVFIENSTVSESRRRFTALFVSYGANLYLTNATIDAHLELYGEMLAKNTLLTRSCYVGASEAVVVSAGHNLAPNDQCGLNQPSDRQDIADFKLDVLRLNEPGLTPTMALMSNSPAIDAGDCSGLQAPTDQRGVNRTQGSSCDVGAYEWQEPLLFQGETTTTTTTTTPGGRCSDFIQGC